MTMKELAKLAGVSTAAVSYWIYSQHYNYFSLIGFKKRFSINYFH